MRTRTIAISQNTRSASKPLVWFSMIPRCSAFRIALLMERSDGRRLEWCLARYYSWPTPIGPSLAGIVGRPAGQVPNFHYSPANKNSGVTWDEATLDRYLTSPGTVVPHTIMTYGGLKDADRRANLIAYLATLH